MIPLKLQLKNFLSYGPELQTVDLSTYPLICLSGKNGHGKSALLDAITWAMWGQARKTSATIKADQGLLRLGQTQMMVVLDFECNGQLYRIKREYWKTYGKPVAILEFGLLNSDTEKIIPLTDKTIKKTQEKIIKTVLLDYEGFTNSAFLRQGNANEFSKKSPKDRKEILANILGLNRYETLRKLAADKAKEAISKRRILDTLQEKIAVELQTTTAVNTESTKITSALKQIKTKELELRNIIKVVEQKRKQFYTDQKNYEILKVKIDQITTQEKNATTNLEHLKKEWETVNKQQKNAPNYQMLEKQKKELLIQLQQHQKNLQKRLALKEESLKTKEDLQKHKQELHQLHAQKTNKKQVELERAKAHHGYIKENSEKLLKQKQTIQDDQEKIKRELRNFEKQQKANNIDKNKLFSMEKQFEKRRNAYQSYIAQANLAQKELEQLAQKKALAHDDNDPSCPLCEQNLSASRRRFLKNKFSVEERFLTYRFTRLSKLVNKLKQILLDQHKQLEIIKKKQETTNLLQVKINELQKTADKNKVSFDQLEKQINNFTKEEALILTKLKKQQKELELLQKQEADLIGQNKECKALQQKLTAIEKEAKQLGYNAKQHEQVTKQLADIEKQLSDYQKLREQITLQKKREEQQKKLKKQLVTIQKELERLTKEQEKYKALAQHEQQVKQEEQKIKADYDVLKKEKETLLQQQGSLENQKKKLALLEKEAKGQRKTVKQLNQTIEDYQAIAIATSKDGIQALLIEEAIPEIEQEANELLAKLTDNQAHIIIESLRDLKKGGTKETLEIKISDSVGIRSYELFSGGEAFRIDFALRIAISKLLARRAGTSLQTLIIDEGFGSQDEEGLGHIMDAIYKIQDDFLKVIIVSHLATMKDQFPVHFVVQKGPNGSKVSVVEHG